MKNTIFNSTLILLVLLLSSCSVARTGLGYEWAKQYVAKFKENQDMGYKPDRGYVPDEKTAIGIAISVWKPIYGESKIEKQAPFFAYLVDDLWVVTGSLPKLKSGGTAKAIIDRDSGKVLHITHYK